MNYFLEYTIPAAPDDAEFEFPHDEIRPGTTIPLSETNADIVHTPELPARTGIIGATVPEAKLEAEQLITHSRATEASLYRGPLEFASGRRGHSRSYLHGRQWLAGRIAAARIVSPEAPGPDLRGRALLLLGPKSVNPYPGMLGSLNRILFSVPDACSTAGL
jgi:hypothetical protein